MKEILVLCPFGVDKGLLSKAARLSGGELRALVPAGRLKPPRNMAQAAFLNSTPRKLGTKALLPPFCRRRSADGVARSFWLRRRCGCGILCPCLRGSWTRD